MTRYAWIIDKDHLADGGELRRDDAGKRGGNDPGGVLAGRLAAGEGEKFRMFDDDGELYYSGRLLAIDDLGAPEPGGLEPLDDFGLPNAGCTSIHYQQADGTWKEV